MPLRQSLPTGAVNMFPVFASGMAIIHFKTGISWVRSRISMPDFIVNTPVSDTSSFQRILIASNDQTNILQLREMLAAIGEIASCPAGDEIHSLVRQSTPILALIDVQDLGAEGYELCSAIARDAAIPVVLVADGIDSECEARALECGAAGFISRPLSAPIVRATVRSLLALKRKNDELASSTQDGMRVREELQKSQALLTSLAAQVPGTLYQYQVFPDGRTCCPFISQSVRDMYGLDPEHLREDASPWFDFVHSGDKPRIRQSVIESATTMHKWKQEYRVVLPAARERWVLGEAMPERCEDGSLVWHGYIRDITEHRMAQERERRLTSIYRALSAANEAIIHVESEAALFPTICRIAVEFGGMTTAGVSVPDENSRFIPVACHGEAVHVEKMIAYSSPDRPHGRGPSGAAFRERRPVVCNDFSDQGMMASWRPIAEKYGIRAAAAFPIVRGGRPYGVLAVYSGQSDAFDEDIVRLLNELSGNIGFALDNFDRKAGLARLSAQMIEAQEQERKSLAMELHDEFGQSLTMLNISLHRMRHSLVDDRAEAAWRSASDEVASLTERVQAMSGSLRPPMLDCLGLESAIQHLLRKHFSNTEVEYLFEYAGLPKKLPGPVEITIYRIVQEAITNTVRHADASRVVVEISGGEHGELEIIVRDDGKGFDPEATESKRTRLGLVGMRERVSLLGGELRIESGRGEGTTVTVQLPAAAAPVAH